MMDPLDQLITNDNGLMTDAHQLRVLVHALVERISQASESLDGAEMSLEAGVLMVNLVNFAFAAHRLVCEDQFGEEKPKEYNPWQLFSQE